MPDPHHSDGVVNVETKHEESDVNVRALLWFVAIFIAFAGFTHLTLWLLFRFFVQLERGRVNEPMTAIARGAEGNVPALPRLQPFPVNQAGQTVAPYNSTPVIDLEEMRANEDRVLHSYGWVDRKSGIVHIPIEEAERLALQSGVYSVHAAETAPAAGGTR
jgi:hypothetical protein